MQSQELTVAEAKRYVDNPLTMWKALERNRYCMPPKTCTLSKSSSYLMRVKSGEYWVPRYGDLNDLPCPDPPTNSSIFAELQTALEFDDKYMGPITVDSFRKEYMLRVLSSLDAHHRFFQKNYYPETNLRIDSVDRRTVSNADGFFTNLHVLPKPSKKKSHIFK